MSDHYVNAEPQPGAVPQHSSKHELSEGQALESQHLLAKSLGTADPQGAEKPYGHGSQANKVQMPEQPGHCLDMARRDPAGLQPMAGTLRPSLAMPVDLLEAGIVQPHHEAACSAAADFHSQHMTDGAWTAQVASIGNYLASAGISPPGSAEQMGAQGASQQPLCQSTSPDMSGLPLGGSSGEQLLYMPHTCSAQLPDGQVHATASLVPSHGDGQEPPDAYSRGLFQELEELDAHFRAQQLPGQDAAWQQSCNVSEQADAAADELSNMPEAALPPEDILQPGTSTNGKLPAALVWQIGGLYAAYAVYAAQPCKPKVSCCLCFPGSLMPCFPAAAWPKVALSSNMLM